MAGVMHHYALKYRMSLPTVIAVAAAANGNARWQQTYQVNFHCLHSSEPAHITENNGIYLVSLLPPSVPKVSYSEMT